VPTGDDAQLVVDRRPGAEDAQQRLEQRQVDHLPGPAPGVTVVQRDHHRQRPGDPGDTVGQAERRQRRRPVLLAGLVREPAHRLHQRAERAPLRVGTGLSEAGHPKHHQPGVDGEEVVGAEAPLLHHTGPEVLHQHVGVGGQLSQQLLPFGLAEVQRHRPLVPRDDLPPQPVALAVPAVSASRVTPGVLDLYHVGAVVAEQHRGDRCRVHRADVEHTNAGQGATLPGRPGRAGSHVGGQVGCHVWSPRSSEWGPASGFLLPEPWFGLALGAVARCLPALRATGAGSAPGHRRSGHAQGATRVTVPVRGVARSGR
jgi:hypothetical protein